MNNADCANTVSTVYQSLMLEVISSVYKGKVTQVTDPQGYSPCPANNFLMNMAGDAFTGIFYTTSGKKIPFYLWETDTGRWSIRY